MAIRARNLDFNTKGMQRHVQTFIGDITASREVTVFVAPVACTVLSVELYNNPNQAVTTSPVVSLYLATATASTLGANHTATLSAGARLEWGTSACAVKAISANNSLTVGMRLAMSFNISGSSNWSAAIVHVRYKPNTYKLIDF
jgi:hypothetical protein